MQNANSKQLIFECSGINLIVISNQERGTRGKNAHNILL
jgi:hypothetical protein